MADRRNDEDAKRAGGRDDDIMGIRHGGGRDQYGGTFGGGQSAGGAYANPHTGGGGAQGGNRLSGDRGNAKNSGGQSGQGYYGSGQMGDRSLDAGSHNAASRASSSESGDARYTDHPSQHGTDVDDALAERVRAQGADTHQGFGAEHHGQDAQGREHGGPRLGRDSKPGRRE